GFERIGDSYQAGPDVSLAAATNFFTVPFNTYVEITPEAYQTALTSQSMSGIMTESSPSNLSAEEKKRWIAALDAASSDQVALVPMPVKPITLGSQTYFEPQRAEVSDLVEQWWGVSISDTDDATRVILYNGSGTPGVAGKAAQQLIRNGVRVVDTKNTDRFDYKKTQVIVQNGDGALGEEIKRVLGVGVVTVQPADQKVADVIVIIGKDYKPPAGATE
ncbi:MAG: LytR C-terminal domain-containing protein, partial [Coriobacteriia bacterium]|nr:LytR C-terminal domain-containing protein [Coriobacteriia bacterium]